MIVAIRLSTSLHSLPLAPKDDLMAENDDLADEVEEEPELNISDDSDDMLVRG